jgi:hypothetical protein
VTRRDLAGLERQIIVRVAYRVQLDSEPITKLAERDPADPGELSQLELEPIQVHSLSFSLAV